MRARSFFLTQVAAAAVSVAVGYGDFGIFENWFADVTAGIDVFSGTRSAVYGPLFFVVFYPIYVVSEPACVVVLWTSTAAATWRLKKDVTGGIDPFWCVFSAFSVVTCNVDAAAVAASSRLADGLGDRTSRACYVFALASKWYPAFFLPFILKNSRREVATAASAFLTHLTASLAFPGPRGAFLSPLSFSGVGGTTFSLTPSVAAAFYAVGLAVSPAASLSAAAFVVGRPRATYLLWGASDSPRTRWPSVALSSIDICFGLFSHGRVVDATVRAVFDAAVLAVACAAFASEVIMSRRRRKKHATALSDGPERSPRDAEGRWEFLETRRRRRREDRVLCN